MHSSPHVEQACNEAETGLLPFGENSTYQQLQCWSKERFELSAILYCDCVYLCI